MVTKAVDGIMKSGDGVSEKIPPCGTQKWRMESIVEIIDLASVELPTGSAQQSEPLRSVLGDNGCTTKIYTSCPTNEKEEVESKLQQEEYDRLYHELFDNSNEYEDFEGFSSEDDDDEEDEPQEEQKRGGREKWSMSDILCLMKCYYQSNPDLRGYRKRMNSLWIENGGFDATEQHLCDQARNVRKKGRLSALQLEEVKRGCVATVDEDHEQGPNVEVEGGNQTTPGNGDENENETNEGIAAEDTNDMNEEEKEIMDQLKKVMEMAEIPKPINLRKMDRNRVRKKTQLVNKVIQKYHTNSITGTNKLIRAGAIVVCNLLGVKEKERKEKQEPFWKRRIEQKIKELRKDISLIERMDEGKLVGAKAQRHKERVDRVYYMKEKGRKRVKEELKQRVTAKAAQIKRYNDRIKQYRQNRMFQDNQRRFYDEIDKGGTTSNVIPDAEESKKFWGEIWGKGVLHNKKAEWIVNTKKQMNVRQQEDMKITKEKVKKRINKIPNWKAPGPDGVQGYWMKGFENLHERIAGQLDKCLKAGRVPLWMTKGYTVLLMKDKLKGGEVSNYRPITCLPLMWKLFTGVMSDEIYEHLEANKALPDEQKGCRRNSRGTKDQLLIDKMVMRNCKRRQVNLSMVWIDYRKAYDMVPHSWIKKTLEMCGVAENIKNVLSESMKTWRTNLTSGNTSLGQVEIKRGIFQGDSLSPLLFVMCMIPLTYILRKEEAGYTLGKNKNRKINHMLFMDDLKLYGKDEKEADVLTNTTRVFTNDIKMEFGITKCGYINLKKGKVVSKGGMELTDGEIIAEIDSGKGYKYLGVIEADDILHTKMKDVIRKEYYRRIRKVTGSKLNGGNVISAMNTWAVSLMRYGAGVINWTKEDLMQIDRKTRKIMTMNRMLHSRSNVGRLYIPRKEGGRGLLGIRDCVEQEEINLWKYVNESSEKLLEEVKFAQILRDQEETVGERKKRNTEKRKEEWKEKVLHGKFVRDTEEVRDVETWAWMRKGYLKKETEGMIIAAQDQALRTNWIKKNIDKQDISEKCRMCGERDESVSHIVAECSKLAQTEYKARHDNVARIIHLELCQNRNLIKEKKWYNHKPESVYEGEDVKILWDFNIYTDHVIQHRRPDIVVFDKKERKCKIVDIACPGDGRVEMKEKEKIENYAELKREVKKIWNCREVKVVPVVVGALGVISRNLKGYLKDLGLRCNIELLQKAALLGTAKVLRKVLET